MTIYIDNDCKCHVSNDGTMREFDVPFFDGKCTEFIEGYRFVPEGETWTRKAGEKFSGEMVAPWKPYAELYRAQLEYEVELLRTELEDADNALNELGVNING